MPAMTAAAHGEGRPLLVRWVTATFVGWSGGFVLAILLIVAAESAGLRETQFPLALGMGIGVGVAQARLLLPYLLRRGPWIAVTALGLAAPFIATDLARGFGVPVPHALAAWVALGGLSAGLLQWRLLRRVFSRAHHWLFASLAGWSLGGSTGFVADRLLPKTPGVSGALQYIGVVLTGGLLLGIITGVVLDSLVRAWHGARTGGGLTGSPLVRSSQPQRPSTVQDNPQ
jgi:hypothetical protein